MKIEDGKRVRLKTKLSVKGGDVLEESVVVYFQGGGTMLPGLEAELEGLEAGAKKKGIIPAAQAFGSEQHQPAATKAIPRAEFPKDAPLEVGGQFAAKGPNGQDVVLLVKKVTDDAIEVQFRHPLADKDIEYDVEVLGVTDPTPPPLPVEAIAGEDGADDET